MARFGLGGSLTLEKIFVLYMLKMLFSKLPWRHQIILVPVIAMSF